MGMVPQCPGGLGPGIAHGMDGVGMEGPSHSCLAWDTLSLQDL